jgi:hypothetical protein
LPSGIGIRKNWSGSIPVLPPFKETFDEKGCKR